MKIELAKIKPNPFRDFDLYPLDREQIQRLSQSIDSLGFFQSVAARPVGGGYELAAGHHRVEAARLAGLKEVEATTSHYSDFEMVQIMALENLSQRGHAASSVLDSVAAFARIVAKEVLLGEGQASKILEAYGANQLASAQAKITADGPGMPLLYRAINGFDRSERKERKEAEHITETEISASLAALKASGAMARIVAAVLDQINAIRVKRADDAATHAKEEEARAALAVKIATPPEYDIAATSAFRLVSHENAFRTSVLSENGRRFIPVEKQAELATAVRAEIDNVERKRNHTLGSVTIKQIVGNHIREAIEAQREIDAAEKAALLREETRERVYAKWKQLGAAVQRVETIVREIGAMAHDWEPQDGLFPMDMAAMQRVGVAATQIQKFQKQLGA